MRPLHELSAAECSAALAAGTVTAEALTRACLERIAAREPVVGAWEIVDVDGALAQARVLDALPPSARGPLHGIPIAVKDLIDTADLPTAYGSPIYAGHQPAADAAIVALARAAGAIVLGKTVTTEFATYQPTKTANPRNPLYTPGGSSSGSAAAVADGMAPVAFGTQTGGSIIRPAAFCGAVGYKPSYGSLPTAGVKPLAESLDTIGALARTVADAARFVSVLSGRAELQLGGQDGARVPSRLGICRTWEWPAAAPETHALFDELQAALGRLGVATEIIALPESMRPLLGAQLNIMAYEAARNLAAERLQHSEQLSGALRAWLETGARITPSHYAATLDLAHRGRQEFADVFHAARCDAFLAPSAPGEAPERLTSTGDPVFNRAWTLLHGPCVHVPLTRGPLGLPLGVQVVGPVGTDPALLRVADWLAKHVVLPATGNPAAVTSTLTK